MQTRKNPLTVPLQTHFALDSGAIDYGSIQDIRMKFVEFLKQNGVVKLSRGRFALTQTEIMTNLVKHPPRKATRVLLRATLDGETLTLDIADDSAPFADFNAKCDCAGDKINIETNPSGAGYGLGCILKQHTSVTYVPSEKSRDGLNHFIVSGEVRRQQAEVQKKKVFLIDDDPVALQIHAAMLGDGYETLLFENACTALEAFPKENPDIIVCDILMPSIDGITLRRELSKLDGGDEIPFVFLTGQQGREHDVYISHLGIDDFLHKPVTRERLTSVVDRLLRRTRQMRGAIEEKFHQDISHLLNPSLPPVFSTWQMTAQNRSASPGGGDFVFYREGEGYLLGLLADVMGHGRQAKFFAYTYAGYLRSLFRMFRNIEDPAHLLKELSDCVADDPLLESMIVTCQAFCLYPDGRVDIASAGHPYPVLISATGTQTIPVAGPLPGLVGQAGYQKKTLHLRPGEKIMLSTDGLCTSCPERCIGAAKDAAAASIGELSEKIWQSHDSCAQQNPAAKDDATIILMSYEGENP